MMKKVLSCLLAVMLFLTCIPTAMAVDNARDFFFELSVDGSDKKEVQPGDIIQVDFNLKRSDSGDAYTMYGMQNEIRYDSNFFELVEGSALLSNGISTTDIGLRDNYREFYMNFVSLSGGEEWNAQRLVGSFKLKVIATSGVSKITNQDYLVSTKDGTDEYKASCQDVTIIISTDCTVTFEPNGGTSVPSQTVRYGETVARPDNPTREGYHLVGWYSDIDLQNPWDFDTDTVQGNVTLYARWEKGDAPETDADGTGSGLWWLLGLGLLGLLLLLLLLLLLGRKTVHFETGCDSKVKDQKVKKGSLVTRPEQPVRPGRAFAGWYADESCTKRWDFDNDKVEDNMTLYAKWL